MKFLFKNYDNDFLKPLKSEKTLEQLDMLFGEICNTYGLERFAIAELINYENKKPESNIYTTYPSEWVNEYIAKSYYRYDPVLVNPTIAPFPFYWSDQSLKKLTLQQQELFENAYIFDIKAGTTIPLMPRFNRRAYFTVLDLNLVNNFDMMFWLRETGDAYFNTRNQIIQSISKCKEWMNFMLRVI